MGLNLINYNVYPVAQGCRTRAVLSQTRCKGPQMEANEQLCQGQPGVPADKLIPETCYDEIPGLGKVPSAGKRDMSRGTQTAIICGVLVFMGIIALVIFANQPDPNAWDAKCYNFLGMRDRVCALETAERDLAAGL